jgi:hypothetical protein
MSETFQILSDLNNLAAVGSLQNELDFFSDKKCV